MAGEKHILKINFKDIKEGKVKTALSRAASKGTLPERKVHASVVLDMDDMSARELLEVSELAALCRNNDAGVSEFFSKEKILADLSYITHFFGKYGIPEKFSEEEKQNLQDIGKYYYGEVK